MSASDVLEPIPMEIAIDLCQKICQEAELRWNSAVARWCWACTSCDCGDPTKRGFARQPGNRGCLMVNARYALLTQN